MCYLVKSSPALKISLGDVDSVKLTRSLSREGFLAWGRQMRSEKNVNHKFTKLEIEVKVIVGMALDCLHLLNIKSQGLNAVCLMSTCPNILPVKMKIFVIF